MRVKATTVQQIILGLALLAALCWNLAQASEIKGLRLSDGATGTRAELEMSGDVAFRTLTLTNPDRFVVDLPQTTASRDLQLPAPAGLIKSVRSGSPVPGTTRIVFDLATPVAVLKPHMEQGANGSARLVLEWPGDGAKPTAASTVTTPPPVVAVVPADPAAILNSSSSANIPVAAGSTIPSTASTVGITPPATSVAVAEAAPKPATPTVEPAAPANKPVQVPRAGTRPLIVAIDAGHGGQDPGAHGPSGKREKDVTLAIARELARQINATPGLKAYLTRDTDVFLPLPKRTQLARAAKADIFISIHADAAENRSAKGSSVYVLSTRGASSKRARWLADKENAADLIGGAGARKPDTTLASVLLDLTQSGQLKASEDAAGHVLSGLKAIGNNHKPDIERANFSVLRTSDMPAMLVETAFISNPDEERRLIDPNYQRSLARAVLDGVDTYFTRQPPPGTLYAARANTLEGTTVASAATVSPPTVVAGGSP